MTFWSAYPNKVKKIDALRAWQNAIKTHEPQTIIDGLNNFVFSDDPKFIPHPSTWLNQQRWLDEPAKTIKKLTALERYAQGAVDLEKQEKQDNVYKLTR
jgi:hypothetical protein